MAHGKNWRTFPAYIHGELLRLMDPYTHAVTVIDSEHRQLHDGMTFDADHSIASIAGSASGYIILEVPEGSFPHLREMSLALEAGDVDLEMFEGPTVTDNGVQVTPVNRNFNSTNTPNMTVWIPVPANVTADGTPKHAGWAPPTSSGGIKVGLVANKADQEYILKQGQTYALKITNNNVGAIRAVLELVWYELSYVNE